MMILDGAHAGGQFLRTSLSLSVTTGKEFKITNIRGKRENPGLQPQHLTAVNAIAEISNAEVEGNALYSKELVFIPKKVEGGKFKFDIGTAGSTTLVFQTLLPALLFAKKESEVEIIGGTANPLAPPALEIKEVFLYFLKKCGIEIGFEILQEGFYPRGGGKIKFKVKPIKKVKEVYLEERGEYLKTEIISVVSEELKRADVGERMSRSFSMHMKDLKNVASEEFYRKTLSPGCYLHVNQEFEQTKIGFTVLGERGKKSEDLGKECAFKFKEIINSDAAVDHFTADQLLMYMALAGGGFFTTDEVTDHLRTNAELIEKFLEVKFTIEKNKVVCNLSNK